MLQRDDGHPTGEGQAVIPAEEARLVAAAKAGDGQAFTELVEASQGDVYTLAYRLTGNEDDARDVAQEAYLRAFRSLNRFRGDAKFSTWMFRITANCAATHLTKRSKSRHDELSESDEVLDERPESDPESMAEAGALRDKVTAALASLPPILRAVVVLRDVYDLPHDAIAAELGITESAAKIRLHRARRKLRDRLFPGSDVKATPVQAPSVSGVDIEQLPENLQEVARMRFQEGLRPSEIIARGFPEGSVHSQLYRIRQLLARLHQTKLGTQDNTDAEG